MSKDNKPKKQSWETASFADRLDAIYLQRFKPVIVKKNKEYGDAALNPIDFMAIDPKSYAIITSRMNEKLNRLKSLVEGIPKEPTMEEIMETTESIEDSVMDLAGYWFLREIVKQDINQQVQSELKTENKDAKG
jgi:hypothetical protein